RISQSAQPVYFKTTASVSFAITCLNLEELFQVTPDHHSHHAFVSDLVALNLTRVFPVAKHDRAIGDLFHFVHAMRDVDDTDVVSFEILHQFEQTASLCKRQTRRWLVHDNDSRP